MSKANSEIRFEKGSSEGYMNTPISLKLQTDIRKAAYTLYNFTATSTALQDVGKVPKNLLQMAKGIVFLTILKVGMIFTGRVGTGLVVARLEDGSWSAPSAVGLSGALKILLILSKLQAYCPRISGLGWGFQIGGELTDVILVLTTSDAVQAFCAKQQVSLGEQSGSFGASLKFGLMCDIVGTELAVSAGVGLSAGGEVTGGMKGTSAVISYAFSKGLFAGESPPLTFLLELY